VSAGPWWEGAVNAELFEAVLGYSRARGAARLLIAAMAAIANEDGVVDEFTTEELCAVAGITERTCGRVRGPLLASGELVLRTEARRRGNRNSWEVPDPGRGIRFADERERAALARPAGAAHAADPVGEDQGPVAARRGLCVGWSVV
jgi:hypothetical protein